MNNLNQSRFYLLNAKPKLHHKIIQDRSVKSNAHERT